MCAVPRRPDLLGDSAQRVGAEWQLRLDRLGLQGKPHCGLPSDSHGRHRLVLGADTPLYPVSLKEALTQDGQPLCVLACNISEVERTGIDPCNKGTIAAHAPLPAWLLPPVQPAGSPEPLPGPATMSCYWGGKVRPRQFSPASHSRLARVDGCSLFQTLSAHIQQTI